MAEEKSNGVLVVPTLNPNEKFVELIDKAGRYFSDIIIVNDGSDEKFGSVFSLVERKGGVVVLDHVENKGKGCALKTAFEYYLSSGLADSYAGVVTADSDSQHEVEDMIRLDKELGVSGENSFHIGYRDLGSSVMPRRSKFGNKFTAFLFRVLYGVDLKDTQSGLRAFSNDVIPWAIGVRGDRFEYEMNVLIKSKNADFCIYEHPIKTKYEEDHKSTFRSIRDSARVMSVLLGGLFKYVLAAIAAAAVDIGVFALLYYAFLPSVLPTAVSLLIATVVSRAGSSVINFVVNRYLTFGGKKISRKSVLRYYALWTVQMGCSYGLVTAFTYMLGYGEVIIKLIVDLALALISYQIQLKFVFAKKTVRRCEGNNVAK